MENDAFTFSSPQISSMLLWRSESLIRTIIIFKTNRNDMLLECKEHHTVSIKTPQAKERKFSPALSWIIAFALILSAVLITFQSWAALEARRNNKPDFQTTQSDNTSVQLTAAASSLNPIRMIKVDRQIPSRIFVVPGSIEANHKHIQQITPLVTGRVKDVFVSTGQQIKKGDLLVVIESPQVAELHGKLHEANSRVELAKSELYRVKEAANQVNILKAKAALDEAEATLKRNRLLVAEGLVPGKDLIAAESTWRQAQAEYEFQKNISLNSEIAKAQSELNTQSTEVDHLRDGLKSLDANVESKLEEQNHDISRIELRAPISGLVLERSVNPGSGVDVGKPLLTLADTSAVWAIANVPEKQVSDVHKGMPVTVSLDGRTFTGEVNYIDPRINEDTRTARVRIKIKNYSTSLPIGSFVDVEFKTQDVDPKAVVYVPESAVQDLDGRKTVFIKTGSGKFRIRTVHVGPTCSNMIPIYKGLAAGQEIVADGSFVLKSTVQKEKFGGDE